jgi:glycosyltransferase involved in cell wall biosynthesis
MRQTVDRTGVLHVVLSLGAGGTERLVIEICQRLQSRFQLAVCALDEAGTWAPELELRGIEVVALGRRPGFRPDLARRIAKVASESGAGILHCHHYSPMVYGSIAAWTHSGLKTVYTEHGRLSADPPSLKRRMASKLVGRLPDEMYAVSHALRRSMIDEGCPASRLQVIHNGIDLNLPVPPMSRREARAALGLPETAVVLGSVARLDPVKDLETAIGAFARARASFPALALVIVGDGTERAHLESVASRLNVSEAVTFAGQRDDARRLLAGVDIYVNSSISEGISLTILEAMAAGLPVVATRVGGTPEVVSDSLTGLLVPARQSQAMADALLSLAAQPERRLAMGHEARQTVERHFTIDRMVDEYARSYTRLAGA